MGIEVRAVCGKHNGLLSNSPERNGGKSINVNETF